MNYGSVLPKDFLLKPAFWIKKDLTDEGNPFKLLELLEGDAVMDCGGFVGTFAAACMEQGAASAVVYEASPKNAAALRDNVGGYGEKVKVIEAALVGTDEPQVNLFLSGFTGAHSVLAPSRVKKSVMVKALNFRKELLRVLPSVLKLDVEGAEYEMLESLRKDDLVSVRTVFIEFHPIDGRDARMERIIRLLTGEGFSIISKRRRAFIVGRVGTCHR